VHQKKKSHLACLLHVQKSGFYGGTAFSQPITALKVVLIGWIKTGSPKKATTFLAYKQVNCDF